VPSSETLVVGQFVHGAISVVGRAGLHVDFQRHQGFVPASSSGALDPANLAAHFAVLDEVDAQIIALADATGRVRLSLIGAPPQVSPEPGQGQALRLPPPRALPGVRPGEGVPFWELYMRRRSTRSWSNRER